MSIDILEYNPKEGLEALNHSITALVDLDKKRAEHIVDIHEDSYKALMFFASLLSQKEPIDEEEKKVATQIFSSVYFLFVAVLTKSEHDYFLDSLKNNKRSYRLFKKLMLSMQDYHKEFKGKEYIAVKDKMKERIFTILKSFKGEFKDLHEFNKERFLNEAVQGMD